MKKYRSQHIRLRYFDLPGQKHSRIARLQRFALLLVFSCSCPCCICRRQRKGTSQLTAVQLVNSHGRCPRLKKEPKKKHHGCGANLNTITLFLTEPTTRPVKNIVALLACSASHCSLFFPARALAVSAAGSARARAS